MAEQTPRAPIIGTLRELQGRYQIQSNTILPPEYEGLKPGAMMRVWTEAHRKMRGFWCHLEFLEKPPVEGVAIDFTQAYEFVGGSWTYNGQYTVPRGYWFSKQGEKVAGIGTTIAVFTHEKRGTSLCFLLAK